MLSGGFVFSHSALTSSCPAALHSSPSGQMEPQMRPRIPCCYQSCCTPRSWSYMISFLLALLELLMLVQAAVQGSAHSLFLTFFHTRMSKPCFVWQAGSFPLALLGLGSSLFRVVEFPGSGVTKVMASGPCWLLGCLLFLIHWQTSFLFVSDFVFIKKKRANEKY